MATHLELQKVRSRQRRTPNRARNALFVVVVLLALGATSLHFFRHKTVANATTSAENLPPIQEIQSGIPGFCLDDYHNNLTKGSIVDSWQCNNSASQAWTVSSSHTIVHDKNDCLSVVNNGTTPGDKIVVNPCNGSPGQVWMPAIDGYENPNSALCLDVQDVKTGKQLAADACNNLTQPEEAWAPAIYSKTGNKGASTACTGSQGQLIACYAAKELVAWQNPGADHPTLLNTYSDGNNYELWCADFVSYVYSEAGYPFVNGERDGWDEYLASNIQYQGFTIHTPSDYTPQPGDVAYFDYGDGHVEVVAVGGTKPIFIYGDSGTTDPTTGLGEMTENTNTSDGQGGELVNYYSPN